MKKKECAKNLTFDTPSFQTRRGNTDARQEPYKHVMQTGKRLDRNGHGSCTPSATYSDKMILRGCTAPLYAPSALTTATTQQLKLRRGLSSPAS